MDKKTRPFLAWIIYEVCHKAPKIRRRVDMKKMIMQWKDAPQSSRERPEHRVFVRGEVFQAGKIDVKRGNRLVKPGDGIENLGRGKPCEGCKASQGLNRQPEPGRSLIPMTGVPSSTTTSATSAILSATTTATTTTATTAVIPTATSSISSRISESITVISGFWGTRFIYA